MQIFSQKFQQLHIGLYSVSTQPRTCSSKLHFYFNNVFKRLHPVNITVRCEHNLYFLRDNFKHTGDQCVSFWKSSHFQKKLCHFMIMMLSFFDLVAVITNNLGLFIYLISWLREDYDLSPICKMYLDFLPHLLDFLFSHFS